MCDNLFLLDFTAALHRMADEGNPTPVKERVDKAVALVLGLSDDAACNGDVHAPDERGIVRPVADLIYDNAPWRLFAVRENRTLLYTVKV